MSESSVVTLTESAAKHIQKNLQLHHAIGLRLSIKKSGCSGFAYITDLVTAANQDDIHHVVENIHLYIDPNCVKYIQGTVIDFVDQGLGQTKMVFHNPNVVDSCGCGESFYIDEEDRRE